LLLIKSLSSSVYLICILPNSSVAVEEWGSVL